MWHLTERIEKALNAGAELEQIHEAIMKDVAPPTEYEFFLAYKAAEAVLKPIEPITQR